MNSADPSSELDRLLRALPAGESVGIADPAIAPEAGEIVLALPAAGATAARPAELARLIEAAMAAGAAAVILPADVVLPAGAPAASSVAVVHKPDSVSWRQLHTALSARLSQPRWVAGDELADLAQTIATLTGGLVTIEDTGARILAYSRSSDEVDELRRLSILGRSGPPAYLALLREWGVYDRLGKPEEVVEIAEHPATGVRRRLAVGVFAGNRQLGTIWVQQGAAEFDPHARQALLGAARLTAVQLVGRGPRRGGRVVANQLTDLLAGLVEPEALGLGRDAGRPCAIAVLMPARSDAGPAEQAQRLDELAAIVTVQAAAFRRHAMVQATGGRLLVLLPALGYPESPDAEAMLEQIVAAIRRHLDPAARASLGPVVRTVAQAAESARGAELVGSVQTAEPVLSFGRARNRLIIQAVHNFLSQQANLLDDRITELIAHDPVNAGTLLRYLDTGSDVGRVATELAVHPTTVRYRLRRAGQALGIDLADPDDRLAVQLQLRHGLRSGPVAG
ncbi:MAG: PucR family transcriptional regulator [Jatrophihabitantaceae bacterium]